MRSTLLLNASYEPLSVVSAKRAVNLILHGKAVPLDASPFDFEHAGGMLNIPYVALMTFQVRRSNAEKIKGPRYSRRGVLVRDNFICQFCGKYGDTIDHVLPVSKGGKSTYENCVTACKSCNFKKGNILLKDLGWELARKPHQPTVYEHLLQKIHRESDAYPVWSQYIDWWTPKRELVSA